MHRFVAGVLVSACVIFSGLVGLAQENLPENGPGGDEEATSAETSLPECPRLLDKTGEPLSDESGKPLYADTLPVLDESGEPVLDENGDPVTEACAAPEVLKTPEPEPATEEMETAPQRTGLFAPLQRLIDAGGPVITILIFLGLLTLAISLVKLAQFLWLGVGFSGFVAGGKTESGRTGHGRLGAGQAESQNVGRARQGRSDPCGAGPA